ncbi:MAG: hypothetical protein H6828_06115 [Planctomycetes bacterium]|nr:hypothetical protein [Planctomycetota bacterium]
MRAGAPPAACARRATAPAARRAARLRWLAGLALLLRAGAGDEVGLLLRELFARPAARPARALLERVERARELLLLARRHLRHELRVRRLDRGLALLLRAGAGDEVGLLLRELLARPAARLRALLRARRGRARALLLLARRHLRHELRVRRLDRRPSCPAAPRGRGRRGRPSPSRAVRASSSRPARALLERVERARELLLLARRHLRHELRVRRLDRGLALLLRRARARRGRPSPSRAVRASSSPPARAARARRARARELLLLARRHLRDELRVGRLDRGLALLLRAGAGDEVGLLLRELLARPAPGLRALLERVERARELLLLARRHLRDELRVRRLGRATGLGPRAILELRLGACELLARRGRTGQSRALLERLLRAGEALARRLLRRHVRVAARALALGLRPREALLQGRLGAAVLLGGGLLPRRVGAGGVLVLRGLGALLFLLLAGALLLLARLALGFDAAHLAVELPTGLLAGVHHELPVVAEELVLRERAALVLVPGRDRRARDRGLGDLAEVEAPVRVEVGRLEHPRGPRERRRDRRVLGREERGGQQEPEGGGQRGAQQGVLHGSESGRRTERPVERVACQACPSQWSIANSRAQWRLEARRGRRPARGSSSARDNRPARSAAGCAFGPRRATLTEIRAFRRAARAAIEAPPRARYNPSVPSVGRERPAVPRPLGRPATPQPTPHRVSPVLNPTAAKRAATRDAYGEALAELGKQNPDVVVLDADLSGSTRTKVFADAFPERFFNLGVAESNMMGTAAGLASMGKVVFASSFAMFAAGKAWEPVRQSICVPHLDVKICATHAGLTVGEDGKSHQMLEDLALMRVLPGMTVLVPADAVEARQAVFAAAACRGPVYVRLSRAKTPIVLGDDYRFRIGKGTVLRPGNDVALVACGVEVGAALEAADLLASEGVEARVINMGTIKPIDGELLVAAARECGAVLTAEEHQAVGGLGSAVAEHLAQHCPVPLELVGVQDTFGESGDADELLAKYGLDAASIAERARRLLRRKN